MTERAPTDTEVEDALLTINHVASLEAEPHIRRDLDKAHATLRAALAAKDAEIERLREMAAGDEITMRRLEKERDALKAQLDAKDAEIARLRARLKSNREMYQRGRAAGFREAAEWLEETLRAKKEAGVCPNWMEPASRAFRAEADRREGGCDCASEPQQVCDVCQGIDGTEKDDARYRAWKEANRREGK